MIGLLGFEWLRPSAALFFLMLPWVALLAFGVSRRRARARHALGDATLVAEIAGERSVLAGRLRVVAELVGLGFLVLALIGPASGFTRRLVERRSLDLVVCVDTSRSMLAEDLRPNRLERARREVRGLIDQLAGDRISLLAFSGDVREVAPLTRDRSTLKALLGELTPDENRRGGTNLGAALGRALDLFDGRTGAHEAIVVLTDGEDLEGGGAAMAERAQAAGIGIFVVGVGTEAGGKIPILGADGKSQFLRGPDGQEVVSKLDRTSLRRLAETSGGAFLTTSDSATPLEELYTKRINLLAGRTEQGGEEKVPSDRYQWALLPGLLALLVAYGLSERRLGARRRRRLSAPVAPMLLASCLFGLLAAPSVHAQAAQASPSLRSVLQSTIEQYADGKRAQALESLDAALGESRSPAAEPALEGAAESAVETNGVASEVPSWSEPATAQLLFARGVVQHGLGALDEARADFTRAAHLAGPGELRLAATYDAAAVALAAAENRRAELTGPQAPPLPGAAPPEDPLAEQRALYLAAREAFVQRLSLDPRDVDTRADLELIVRRLRELDQLEKERQEEQDQQDQEQQPSDEPSDSESEPSDEESEQESEDSESSEEPQEQDESGEPDEQESSDAERDPTETEESEPQPDQPEETQESEPQPLEPLAELSKEELARLMDRLMEMEAQQAELERRLRRAGRQPVERDW